MRHINRAGRAVARRQVLRLGSAAAVSALLAACGGSTGPAAATTTTSVPPRQTEPAESRPAPTTPAVQPKAPVVATAAATAQTVVAAATAATRAAPASGASGQPTAATPPLAAAGAADLFAWTFEEVATAAKPSVAVGPDGTPHLGFMLEDQHGWVKHAQPGAEGWTVDEVAQGYFYGPLALAVDSQGRPHFVWHDHQETTLNPKRGDQAYALRGPDGWQVEPIPMVGHDGWDNAIALDSQDRPWTASINPVDFGGPSAVDVSHREAGTWVTTPVGSPPGSYMFGTSLALDADDRPHVAYYEEEESALGYATLVDGVWQIQTVDAEGDSGKFASVAIDAAGHPAISYYRQMSETSGMVRYAQFDGSAWQSEDVAELAGVHIAFIGARNVTQLQFDGSGRPLIAYSGAVRFMVARREADGWGTQVVVTAADNPLGEQTSFRLGPDGRAHIAYFDVAQRQPLQGTIGYGVGEPVA